MAKEKVIAVITGWSFAKVNGRLAEIYFHEHGKGQVDVLAHCYVKQNEYSTKQEQQQIKKDTDKVRVVFSKGQYQLMIL